MFCQVVNVSNSLECMNTLLNAISRPKSGDRALPSGSASRQLLFQARPRCFNICLVMVDYSAVSLSYINFLHHVTNIPLAAVCWLSLRNCTVIWLLFVMANENTGEHVTLNDDHCVVCME